MPRSRIRPTEVARALANSRGEGKGGFFLSSKEKESVGVLFCLVVLEFFGFYPESGQRKIRAIRESL